MLEGTPPHVLGMRTGVNAVSDGMPLAAQSQPAPPVGGQPPAMRSLPGRKHSRFWLQKNCDNEYCTSLDCTPLGYRPTRRSIALCPPSGR